MTIQQFEGSGDAIARSGSEAVGDPFATATLQRGLEHTQDTTTGKLQSNDVLIHDDGSITFIGGERGNHYSQQENVGSESTMRQNKTT